MAPDDVRPGEAVSAEELRRRLKVTNITNYFGFEIADVHPGHVILRMHVNDRHKQVHGVVHGGVLAALADTAGGFATYTTCIPGTRTATIEMKINFLEGVDSDVVEADARVIRRGRHIAVVDCDIRDKRRLVGKALMTFFVGPFGKKVKKTRR